ncbi:MAG TPA: tetratricopeptide repeat protein, partial [Oscillatoriales cyanobacterium M4454_W2019_049]|nr:tetratricopeptide repeat protein [Oscillatoriales cyanobacterium M4454_W2019_049]
MVRRDILAEIFRRAIPVQFQEWLRKMKDLIIGTLWETAEMKAVSWSVKAFELEELGRYEEAIASYDKALEFQPDD